MNNNNFLMNPETGSVDTEENWINDCMESACEFYNHSDKSELIDWATDRNMDIGQGKDMLDADWNEKIIDEKFKEDFNSLIPVQK